GITCINKRQVMLSSSLSVIKSMRCILISENQGVGDSDKSSPDGNTYNHVYDIALYAKLFKLFQSKFSNALYSSSVVGLSSVFVSSIFSTTSFSPSSSSSSPFSHFMTRFPGTFSFSSSSSDS